MLIAIVMILYMRTVHYVGVCAECSWCSSACDRVEGYGFAADEKGPLKCWWTSLFRQFYCVLFSLKASDGGLYLIGRLLQSSTRFSDTSARPTCLSLSLSLSQMNGEPKPSLHLFKFLNFFGPSSEVGALRRLLSGERSILNLLNSPKIQISLGYMRTNWMAPNGWCSSKMHHRHSESSC